jgi:hypothetical protein
MHNPKRSVFKLFLFKKPRKNLTSRSLRLRMFQKQANAPQGSNPVAEYFEGRQDRNSEQRARHSPEIGPQKKSEEDRDRVES